MRKYRAVFALAAAFMAQGAFADISTSANTQTGSEGMLPQQCKTIASACVSAGYTIQAAADKSFWRGCMHPVLLGKTVSGVTVDTKDVTACKEFKVEKMKKELEQLQQQPVSQN